MPINIMKKVMIDGEEYQTLSDICSIIDRLIKDNHDCFKIFRPEEYEDIQNFVYIIND